MRQTRPSRDVLKHTKFGQPSAFLWYKSYEQDKNQARFFLAEFERQSYLTLVYETQPAFRATIYMYQYKNNEMWYYCGNETSIHQSSNEVEEINYRQLNGLEQCENPQLYVWLSTIYGTQDMRQKRIGKGFLLS